MFEDFVREVAEALNQVPGFDAKAEGRKLLVAGCTFWANTSYRRGSDVSFANSNFAVRRGRFDVNRAVRMVLRELPKEIRARERAEEHRRVRETREGKVKQLAELLGRKPSQVHQGECYELIPGGCRCASTTTCPGSS